MGLKKESSRKYKQIVLMVTHNEVLAQACDRVLHIEDGELVPSFFKRRQRDTLRLKVLKSQ